MPITLPQTNANGSLRYFDEDELALIDLKRRGVRSDHSHIVDEMGPDGSSSVRKFSSSWEERYAAAILLTGYVKDYEVDGVIKISRLLPDMHPAVTNFTWVCTKVRLDPWRFTGELEAESGAAQRGVQFTRCDITANYEIVPFGVLDDDEVTGEFDEMFRYVTEPGYPGAEIATKSEYIQLAGGTMKFASVDGLVSPAGIPIPYAVGRTETTSTKKAIWHRVPLDIWGPGKPLTQMVKGDGVTRGYIGSMNLTEIWGHPPLTLKLEGVEERLLPDASGFGFSWSIVYLFSEKCSPYGHSGLWFGTTAIGGTPAAYYQALNASAPNAINKTAAQLAADDALSLFHVREHRNLFLPGGA